MSILFISDLHLDAHRPEATRAFHRFLDDRASKAEALYILGDLFEAWVGDDDDAPLAQEVIEALARLTAGGTAVFFAHGNRDFLIGEDFARRSGAGLLEEMSVIELGGEPILLAHGDSMCTDDHDYQAFRAMVRNPEWQARFLSLALPARRAVAAQARDASRASTRGKAMEIMDVNLSAVADAMRSRRVRRLIHGHTHRPAVHEFILDGQPAIRTVLGDWFRRGWALEWSEERFSLDAFDL